MRIVHHNTKFHVITEIPSREYFVWNIGIKHAPNGYVPFCRLDPNEPASTTKIDQDNILALLVKDDADREAIMEAASMGICDIESAVLCVNKATRNKPTSGSLDELTYKRAFTALPALKKLPWDEARAVYCG